MTEPRDKPTTETLTGALRARFGEDAPAPADAPGLETLALMAARGACRAFRPEPVDPELIRLLAAVALSSPSKSDLQQRDIVVVSDPERRRTLDALVAGQPWIADAPALLVFCGNNRRQRQIHAWRGRPFANDHLDAMFNAAVDAGVALSAFGTAADAVGLGSCPISAVRNRAAEVSDLLGLPEHVFPVAGLALGWPAFESPRVSMRLPLSVTLHQDRFEEAGVRDRIEAYDRARAAVQPYRAQRDVETFGEAEAYGWSEDKARQYAKPERAEFAAFLRAKCFQLD
ncbi:MAG: nitroreductase family protein [Pseudomonadota bacterium]